VRAQVTGPKHVKHVLSSKLQLLDQQLEGDVSPCHDVTIPKEFRKGAGVPEEAEQFCFIHPLAEETLARIHDAVHEGALSLARNDWAFVLLAGGYAYFRKDEHGQDELLRVNAITLAPSDTSLLLVGDELGNDDGNAKSAVKELRQKECVHATRAGRACYWARACLHTHRCAGGV
jgi:hypothetical protein